MRVTMRDVAKQAGVSIKTVSRVVNDQGEISPRTREKVLAVIQKLGYRPNLAARSLVTQKSGTVGLVVGDITNPFFTEVARGVQDAAQAKNYHIFLCNSDNNAQQEDQILNTLSAQGADGIIVFPIAGNEEQLKRFADTYRTIVAINHVIEHPNISQVMADNIRGAKLVVDYLVDRGHTEIGMLTATQGARRVQGFRAAMAAQGLAIIDDRIALSLSTIQGGEEAARQLLTRHPSISAIFAYNDLIALGAIRSCQALGRSVPADCAVVGFDNTLLATIGCPTLTTVHTDKYELGHQAFTQLSTKLDNPDQPSSEIRLDVNLVVRESA